MEWKPHVSGFKTDVLSGKTCIIFYQYQRRHGLNMRRKREKILVILQTFAIISYYIFRGIHKHNL